MKRNETTIKDYLNRKMFSVDAMNEEEGGGGGATTEAQETDTKTGDKAEEFDSEAFRTGGKETGATEEEQAETESNTKTKEEDVTTEKATETKTVDDLDDYWSALSDVVSTDDNKYSVPDYIKTGKKEDGSDLTKQEKLQLLAQETLKYSTLSQNKDVDGIIKHMLAASSTDNDFTLSNYISDISSKFVNTADLSDDDKLFNVYKGEYGKKNEEDVNGMSDDEIKEEISKMSKFEKKDHIKQIDTNQIKIINQETEQYKVQYNDSVDAALKEWQPQENKYLDNFLNNIKSNPNIEGFDFSDADKEQFIKDLPEFYNNKIVHKAEGYNDITSGVNNVLSQIMADPELAIRLTPFLWLVKNNKLQGYTSKIKEETKKKIEDKLSSEPGGYQSSSTGYNDFDGGKFRKGN